MPIVNYSDLVASKSKIFQKECTICYDQIDERPIRRIITCEHLFHDECLKSWLKEKETCPNCKIPLNKKTLDDHIAILLSKNKEAELTSGPVVS